jgi:hypothetical protein
MDLINGITQENMKTSIFKVGVYEDIDKVQEKINSYYSFFDKLS